MMSLISRLVQRLDRPINGIFRRDVELARLLLVATDGAASNLTDWIAQQARGNSYDLDPAPGYRAGVRKRSCSSSPSSPEQGRTRSGSRSSDSRSARPTSRSPTPEGSVGEEVSQNTEDSDKKPPCPLEKGPNCDMCKCATLVNPL